MVKKLCSDSENLDDQARSNEPKTIYIEAVLQAIAANPVSSTQRVSGELSISQSSVICHLRNLPKVSEVT